MRFSKRVEFVRRLIHTAAKPKLLHALEKLGILESSRILRQLDAHDQKLFFEIFRKEDFLDKMLLEIPAETLPTLLSVLEESQLIDLLNRMPPDFGKSYLDQFSADRQNELLEKLPLSQKEKMARLSQYPSDSCGEAMHTEFMFVKASQGVQDAVQTVRTADPQLKIFYLYVVDEENHLLGTVPLRTLVREDPEKKVEQIMLSHPIAVRALDSRRQAAQLVSHHKLLAVPVVDEAHHLLGVITVDDVIDIVQDEATEEMYHLAGLTKNDRAFAPWWPTTKRRLVWMSINLGTAFLAAWVVGLFQQSIAKVVALAIFMPVVAGMGGNGGTQSLTVMTRALALGEISGREIWKVLRKEVLVGLTVGAITGMITGFVAWHWEGNFYLGLVLWLAMICNMMIAAFAGNMIPMLLRTLKLDPALGAGVLVTTFTDVFGFLIFLGFATLFLRYLC